MADYPTTFTTLPRPGSSTPMNSSGFEGDIVVDKISDEVEAVEHELGPLPKGVDVTVRARLDRIDVTDPAAATPGLRTLKAGTVDPADTPSAQKAAAGNHDHTGIYSLAGQALSVNGNTTVLNPAITGRMSSATAGAVIQLQRASAAGGAVAASDQLGGFAVGGHNGTAFLNNTGGMFATSPGTWSGTSTPTTLTFVTTAIGSTTPTTRLTLDTDGNLTVAAGTVTGGTMAGGAATASGARLGATYTQTADAVSSQVGSPLLITWNPTANYAGTAGPLWAPASTTGVGNRAAVQIEGTVTTNFSVGDNAWPTGIQDHLALTNAAGSALTYRGGRSIVSGRTYTAKGPGASAPGGSTTTATWATSASGAWGPIAFHDATVMVGSNDGRHDMATNSIPVIGYLSTATLVGTGSNYYRRVGWQIADAVTASATYGTATLAEQYGVLIPALSAATKNVGFQNASTTVYPATVQALTAASQVNPVATLLQVTSTADVTLTDPTNILPGSAGQVVRIRNTGLFSITFTHGNKVKFQSAQNFSLLPNDSVEFIYRVADTTWYASASHTANLALPAVGSYSSGARTLASASRLSGVVTAATTVAHGYASGDQVEVVGCTPTTFNGLYTITVTSATAFTYVKAGTDESASPVGTVSHSTIVSGVGSLAALVIDSSYAQLGTAADITARTPEALVGTPFLLKIARRPNAPGSGVAGYKATTSRLSGPRGIFNIEGDAYGNHYFSRDTGPISVQTQVWGQNVSYGMSLAGSGHTGTTATITTADLTGVVSHGFHVGQEIDVRACKPDDYNGRWTVSAVTPTTVSYVMSTTPATNVTTTGIIAAIQTQQPTGYIANNRVWYNGATITHEPFGLEGFGGPFGFYDNQQLVTSSGGIHDSVTNLMDWPGYVASVYLTDFGSSTRTVTAGGWAGNVATLTSIGHSFRVGDRIKVRGVVSANNLTGVVDAGFNGTFIVTVAAAGSTQFSYALTTDPGLYQSAGTARTVSTVYRRKDVWIRDISANNGGARPVSAATWAANIATVTVANHEFAVGDTVRVTEVVPFGYNGVHVVTETPAGAPNTFKFALATAPVGAYQAGTGTARSDMLVDAWRVNEHVGIDIEQFTRATTNTGLRNFSTTVLPPTSQHISAATDQIDARYATTVKVDLAAPLTLTSNPCIRASGADGQTVILRNDDPTDILTLPHGNGLGTLDGQNLVMAPGDSVLLQYRALVGSWKVLSRGGSVAQGTSVQTASGTGRGQAKMLDFAANAASVAVYAASTDTQPTAELVVGLFDGMLVGPGGTTAPDTGWVRTGAGEMGGAMVQVNRMRATAAAVGTEVVKIASTSAGDDPEELVVQGRRTTPDATPAALTGASTTIAAGSGRMIEARVTAHQTSGAADVYLSHIIRAVYKNVAGTVSIVGTPPLPTVIGEDAGASAWDVTFTVNGTSVDVTVTGAAATSITWHGTTRSWLAPAT